MVAQQLDQLQVAAGEHRRARCVHQEHAQAFAVGSDGRRENGACVVKLDQGSARSISPLEARDERRPLLLKRVRQARQGDRVIIRKDLQLSRVGVPQSDLGA